MKYCSNCNHLQICNLHHYGSEAQECIHYSENLSEVYIISVLGSYQWFTLPNVFTKLSKAQEYIRKLPDEPKQVSETFFYSKNKKYSIKSYKIEE